MGPHTAADELLKQNFPTPGTILPSVGNRFWSDLFARRITNFQQGVRTFLFPELYGYPKTSPSTDGAFVRAESIRSVRTTLRHSFPEPQGDPGLGHDVRVMEESADLWRLNSSSEADYGRQDPRRRLHEEVDAQSRPWHVAAFRILSGLLGLAYLPASC